MQSPYRDDTFHPPSTYPFREHAPGSSMGDHSTLASIASSFFDDDDVEEAKALQNADRRRRREIRNGPRHFYVQKLQQEYSKLIQPPTEILIPNPPEVEIRQPFAAIAP